MATSTPETALATRDPQTIEVLREERTFDLVQRKAKALAASSLVPASFQNNVPNCIIALELAARLGCNAFMVMQNLAVIQGRPSLSSQFLIATVNSSGRFTPLRFRFTGDRKNGSFGCIAVAQDKATGEVCEGTEITLDMAKSEGWSTRNGSKWKTMPEQMLRYRAAAFWVRIYCPELSMGMMSAEENVELGGQTYTPGKSTTATSRSILEAEIMGGEGSGSDGTQEAGREREGESQDFGVSDCSGARAVGGDDCSAPEGQHEEV